MCGSLKHEEQASKIGTSVRVEYSHSKVQKNAIWAGFAKKEKLDWWKNNAAAKPVTVFVDSFIEGTIECRVPSRCFFGIVLDKDVVVQGRVIGHKGSVKILTRDAVTPFEKKLHPRWPLSPQANQPGFQTWV